MIPTTRRLQHARGYLGLGMVNEASDELKAIDWDDRMKPELLAMRVDLYQAAKNWELMADIAMHLAETLPDQSDGWFNWAYALREMDKVTEAKDVALKGLELHPDQTIHHFDLACYLSLLGEYPAAKKHLNRSIKLDERFKAEAVEDEDLASVDRKFNCSGSIRGVS